MTQTDQEFAVAHAERCRKHLEHLDWTRTLEGRLWYAEQLLHSPEYQPWRDWKPRHPTLAKNFAAYFTFAELTHDERMMQNHAYRLRAAIPITRELRSRFNCCLRNTQRDGREKGYLGILATLEELAASYTGYCQLCDIPESECRSCLAADHDHKTGRFRGWLCRPCNEFIR